MNIARVIDRTCETFASKVCAVEGERRLTFGEVERRANALAHFLTSAGVRPGDRVAIFQTNCLEFPEMVYAIEKAGAILVTINFRLREEETKYILSNSTPRVLLLGARYGEMINDIRFELPSIACYVSLGGPVSGMVEYETALHEASSESFPSVWRAGDDGACIIYTSGTTGLPKGATITHDNLLTPLFDRYTFHPGTILINVPMYHIAGISSVALPLYRGDTMVFLPAFDPGLFLKVVEKERIETTYLVPTMLQAVLEHPDFSLRNTTSLKHIGYGASPMPVNLLLRATEMLSVQFTNFYGMTETTGLISVLPPEDHLLVGDEAVVGKRKERLASVGRCIPGSEVSIVDDRGEALPSGKVGEIVARGPKLMKGYWQNEAATKETIRDGWLHTGDLAYRDEEGYIFLKGRKKDMIIRGGENIYPAEIEFVLHKHPKIKEAAVIGVPDDYWGEMVKAVVVLKEGENATEEEIISYCRGRLASYKKPSIVEFRDSLPKNAMQKVLKAVLREESIKGEKPKF
ncbi:MAG TPA: long-chain-fatty-acid--CoA ligase [Syntrophales bacterium]|nr:long-chain-fatty-acid--CoA ligase [Syntrophales bacterium]HOL59884.1 long-chain-fatty-acid--CoA ligase [Syntrophales bacterium]HPO36031.1 long-chain-fatty-acid--CoA ligase [Syntrophales bacterium]